MPPSRVKPLPTVRVKPCRTQERGGEQGDYRAGIDRKIANAIGCLKAESLSKRATITFPFSGIGSEENDWTNQGMNKCCRELHLYLEDGKLKCTGIVRMQNANVCLWSNARRRP